MSLVEYKPNYSSDDSMSSSYMRSPSVNNDNNLHIKKLNEEVKALQIIPNRLYFMISRSTPTPVEMHHFFSTDDLLTYVPFFVDFGPLNLACLYKFCAMLKHKLHDSRYHNHKIYYYSSEDPQKIANAAYLMACFQVIELQRHPVEVCAHIQEFAKRAIPFRDASMGICMYKCTIEHCCWAVYRAIKHKCIDFNQFNVDEYEYYENVECGDLSVIIPGQFIAFAGPHDRNIDEDGYPALSPDFYIPIWKKFGVSTIVRLNKKCYDKRTWTKLGFEHYDLYFVDGTTPSDAIIARFLEICETAKGTVAVHCKAGLGRTGSLIGCYLMKHYGWTAAEVIAWLRICRPGSVIGPQQFFLEEKQSLMWKLGDEYRKWHGIQLEYDPRLDTNETWNRMCKSKLELHQSVKELGRNKKHTQKKTRIKSSKKYSATTQYSNVRIQGTQFNSRDQNNQIEQFACTVGSNSIRKQSVSESTQNHSNSDIKSNSNQNGMNYSSSHHISQAALDLLMYAAMKTKSYVNPLFAKNSTEPLPTDPGQNQGKALLDAKRKHSPLRPHGSSTNENKSCLNNDNEISPEERKENDNYNEMDSKNTGKDGNFSIIGGISTRLRFVFRK